MTTPAEIAALANIWHAGPDATPTPRVRGMIAAEVARIHRAFARLPFGVVFVPEDPYPAGYEEMRDAVRSTGVMCVYQGGSDTPTWDPLTNWMARAVHDFDHIRLGVGFDVAGERAAFRASAARVPGLAPFYLSEILLQAAGFAHTGAFSPVQKVVLAPEEALRWLA